jgi:hypothetical protein
MCCKICGRDNAGTVYVLPLRQKDGSLTTLACERCAVKSGAYCIQHAQIHQGFTDGSTACLTCIQIKAFSLQPKARIFAEGLLKFLGEEEAEELKEAAEIASAMRGWGGTELAILIFLISKAFRTKQNLAAVLLKVMDERSANYLLE